MSPAPIDAAQNRGADQNADAQGDAEREQRPSLDFRADARHGVAAVTGAKPKRLAAEPRGPIARGLAALAEAIDHVA